MNGFIRPAVVGAALLVLPAVAMAANDEFKTPAPNDATVIVNPGLWFTVKNGCTGTAYATIGDKICQLKIDSATFMTKIRSGTAPAGYSEMFNTCAGSDGNGSILFVPSAAQINLQAVLVSVAPNSTVTVPSQFCN